MDNEKKESKPADMHSDGVHFDKEILESKRNESARASGPKEDTSKEIKTDSPESNGKDNSEHDHDKTRNTTEKTKEEVIKDMEGGYNRDAPINDKNRT